MKLITNLFLSILFGSICFNSVKAEDLIYYAIDRNRNSSDPDSDAFNTFGNDIYTCNSAGECTFKTRSESFSFNGNKTYVDNENNLMMHTLVEEYTSEGFPTVYQKYDKSNQKVSTINDWKNDYDYIYKLNLVEETSDDSDTIVSVGESLSILENSKKLLIGGNTILKKNEDGTIQIGTDTDDIDITAQGLTVDGVSLITKKESGEIHIGKNSLITKEEDGVQKLYAQDEDGNAININLTNGSKLLIDGVEVQTDNNAKVTTNKSNISTNTSNISTNTSNIFTNKSNISTNTSNITTNKSNISTNTSNITTNKSNISTNTSNITINKLNISTNTSNISTNTSNVNRLGEGVAGSTALTAALSALPQTSKQSKLSCGVGTGAYSSRYAVGFGCASKVNERVDINAGGSYVFGGSKSYGGGTLDSGVVKAGFVFKLGELNKPSQISMKDKKKMETKIQTLEEKNKKIISKNLNLENTVSILIARLERLEKIASRDIKSLDLESIKD